jgi:hypothetical protein
MCVSQAYQEFMLVAMLGDPAAHAAWNGMLKGLTASGHKVIFQLAQNICNWKAGWSVSSR